MEEISERKISGRADLITEQIITVICTLQRSPYGTNLNHTQLFKLATKIIKNLDKVAEKALDAIIEAQDKVGPLLLINEVERRL